MVPTNLQWLYVLETVPENTGGSIDTRYFRFSDKKITTNLIITKTGIRFFASLRFAQNDKYL